MPGQFVHWKLVSRTSIFLGERSHLTGHHDTGIAARQNEADDREVFRSILVSTRNTMFVVGQPTVDEFETPPRIP